MLFPATLRVADGRGAHFFRTPQEARDWLEERGTQQGKGPLKNPEPAADAKIRKDTGREPWCPHRRKHKRKEPEPRQWWPPSARGRQPTLNWHNEGNQRIGLRRSRQDLQR
ncbi:hypothetical protein NDU88_001698 [Pleurodeles waltl]|uniref:Uncharacterized protein n=1 Tax=Pleurodeles waltl TaxID=8319 RepID=A0AAV7UUT4_PLEWA|nr:hypothetical protein NDU88_001698 [Pleurodeles waltl]